MPNLSEHRALRQAVMDAAREVSEYPHSIEAMRRLHKAIGEAGKQANTLHTAADRLTRELGAAQDTAELRESVIVQLRTDLDAKTREVERLRGEVAATRPVPGKMPDPVWTVPMKAQEGRAEKAEAGELTRAMESWKKEETMWIEDMTAMRAKVERLSRECDDILAAHIISSWRVDAHE